MAYKMRWRTAVFLINPQNNAANEPDPADAGQDVPLLAVGSYEAVPTSPVLYSLPKATAAAMSVVNRLQSSMYTNVRFEVFGMPVGAPEVGAPDLSAEQKVERRYVQGDTPNPALLIALHKANRKPADPNAGPVQFVPADNIPEVNQVMPPNLNIGVLA